MNTRSRGGCEVLRLIGLEVGLSLWLLGVRLDGLQVGMGQQVPLRLLLQLLGVLRACLWGLLRDGQLLSRLLLPLVLQLLGRLLKKLRWRLLLLLLLRSLRMVMG